MNTIAAVYGSTVIYWNSLIIVLGIAAGLCLSLSLCRIQSVSKAAVVSCFPFLLLFSLAFGRFLHWYSNSELYTSFASAMMNHRLGGYCIVGVVPAALLSARIVRLFGLTKRTGALLDVIAPGMTLALAFVRLSALFAAFCRSKVPVTNPLFQRLPFAVASVDTAGNVEYRLATFFLSFLALILITAFAVVFIQRTKDRVYVRGAGNQGNAANIVLLLCCAVEILLDSTRSDASMLNFFLLGFLNKYVSFVSVGMLFCAVYILFVFLHYIKRSIKSSGKIWSAVLLIFAFVVTVVGAGLSEYFVQRYTGMFLLYRSLQGVSVLLMVIVVFAAYKRCVIEK